MALSATLMSTLINFNVVDWMRWFVGSSFLVFGGAKLISYESFLEVFPRYNIVAHRWRLYAMAYPIVELILGVMFILDMASGFRNIVAILMTGSGLYSLVVALQHKGPSANHTWLGQAFKLPMSTVMLFEDAVLTVLLLVIIIGSLFR